jgi:hypothetical protein
MRNSQAGVKQTAGNVVFPERHQAAGNLQDRPQFVSAFIPGGEKILSVESAAESSDFCEFVFDHVHGLLPIAVYRWQGDQKIVVLKPQSGQRGRRAACFKA